MKSKNLDLPQNAESEAREGRPPSEENWSAGIRLAFRFAFAYLALYSLLSHVLVYLFVPPRTMPGQGLGTLGPLYSLTSWIGRTLFGLEEPLVYTGNSRDTTFFWVQLFVIAAGAIIATALWSALDSRRRNYVTLHKWFRLFIRFAVAAQMFYFGMVKVIPTQFPPPSLITLVAPVGNLSLQGLLWTSTGSSPAYQIFTGVVELAAAFLLLARPTTVLGAIICAASMIHVFVLNMTYDIGVKILSFHIILMAGFLIAPDLSRLVNVFIRNRAVEPFAEPELFRTARANRLATIAQVVFGLYLLAVYTDLGRSFWYADGGGGSPKSALYGIWDIEEMAVDGEVRVPSSNDYDRRWRRVIFDHPEWIYFQRTDDSFIRYGVTLDAQNSQLALSKGRSRNWRSNFSFQRPTGDQMVFEGQMDGYQISMKLRLVEFDTFRLLNSTFRWARPSDEVFQ